MGSKSLNVLLNLLLMLNMCQCLFIISLIFGSTGLFVKKMIMTLYVLVYSVLKVMICLGGQLFQLDFLQSIHYSPFNKSFYEFLGMVSVFLKG